MFSFLDAKVLTWISGLSVGALTILKGLGVIDEPTYQSIIGVLTMLGLWTAASSGPKQK